MAPPICMEFRGVGSDERLRRKATEAALSSYIATKKQSPDAFSSPQVTFAFVYLASHFALDLLEGDVVDEIMEYVEANQDKLMGLTRS